MLPTVLPLPAVFLPDRGPPRHRRTGTQLASALCKYAFPPVSLLAQTLCKLREDEEQVLLVAPHWPTRTWFPKLISLATAPPLAHSSEEGPPLSGAQHHMAPTSSSVEPPCVAPGRDAADLSGSTTGSDRDHHSALRSYNKANLRTEMESRTDVLLTEKTLKDARLE